MRAALQVSLPTASHLPRRCIPPAPSELARYVLPAAGSSLGGQQGWLELSLGWHSPWGALPHRPHVCETQLSPETPGCCSGAGTRQGVWGMKAQPQVPALPLQGCGPWGNLLSLSVLSFLTCDVGTGSTSTSQDSCEGGFGSLLTVDSLERRLAQSTQLAKGA